MDKQETAAVLSLMKMNYPNHFKSLSSAEANILLDFWTKELSKFDYEIVCNAVHTVIRRSEFCPAISQVLEQIKIDTRGNEAQETKCQICDGVGLIHYSKNVDYKGKIGVKEVICGCRCSCNTATPSIPSYRETFGFDPLPREKNTEKVNVSEIIADLKKLSNGFEAV